MLHVVPNRCVAAALLMAGLARPVGGQPTNGPVPDPLSQLMVTQPSIEVVTNPVAVASFDPPVVHPGELSTYRVTINALDDSIRWPGAVPVPSALAVRPSARGQILLYAGNRLVPQTTLNHHVRANRVGTFTIEPFVVEVYGKPVTVAPARLVVVSDAMPTPPPGRRLAVEVPTNEVFVGQSVAVRVIVSGSAIEAPQRLAQVRLNGEGFLVDHSQARQSLSVSATVNAPGTVTSTYETPLTPLVAGELRFSAQGFASRSIVSGPILIPGQPVVGGVQGAEVLLDSDAVTLNVRPLPRNGALPGFTGAIGEFTCDPPQLSTNRARVGDTVQLTVTIRGEGNLARLVPPAPAATTDWHVSAPIPGRPAPPAGSVVQIPGLRRVAPPGPSASFVYTMIPLAVSATATPAIPFSYFDPGRGVHVDLTVPPVPIEVTAGTMTNAAQLWVEVAASADITSRPLALSALASAPGRSVSRLAPLQWRGWFVLVQLLPLVGFTGLWTWDRRRRYLEQHPEVVRRRQARRALRREWRALARAFAAADAQRYAEAAVRAMCVACAPHFPAEPRALVGQDVLEVAGQSASKAEVVRRFFAVVNASHFSVMTADARELLALHPRLEQLLSELEARL